MTEDIDKSRAMSPFAKLFWPLLTFCQHFLSYFDFIISLFVLQVK